jgi:hypothetical protein
MQILSQSFTIEVFRVPKSQHKSVLASGNVGPTPVHEVIEIESNPSGHKK